MLLPRWPPVASLAGTRLSERANLISEIHPSGQRLPSRRNAQSIGLGGFDVVREKKTLLFQFAAEAITFAVDSGDDFWSIGRGFKMFANAPDGDINRPIMGFQFAAGHFFQQLGAGLDFAGVFAKVQHGAEFAAW